MPEGPNDLVRLDAFAEPQTGAGTPMALAAARARTPWVTDDDVAAVLALEDELQAPRLSIGLALFHESGWKAWARNEITQATGIMQWTPPNAPVPVGRLLAMRFAEQFPFAAAWFRKWLAPFRGGPIPSAGVVYAAVAAPGKITGAMDDMTVLYRKPDPEPPDEKKLEWAWYANPTWRHPDDPDVIRVRALSHVLERDALTPEWAPFAARMLA